MNTNDVMFVSEARVLYAFNAEVEFLVSMSDRQTREDVETGKRAGIMSDQYAELLKRSGAPLPDIHSDEAREWWRYKVWVGSTLYEERKGVTS